MRRKLLLLVLLGASAPALWAQVAPVDAYPSKPIRILVGFTPGGGPDITARYLSSKLGESWKQAVVVENRLGAGSNVAAQALANATADGYTLLSVSSAHAVSPAIYPKLPYDVHKDFAGITLTATGPALVMVSPQLGVKTMGELIALAKSKPGQLNFASAGVGSGSHFAVELLKSQVGIDMLHIPYKGIPEALTETIAGRTQVFISPYASAINLVKEGKATAIAVTSLKRMPDMPDVPTVAESGAPGYQWVFWYGLLAPAKTPRAIVDKLNAEIGTILKQPEVRQRFGPLGIEPVTSSPEEFDKLIVNEVATFTRLAKAGNIKLD
ncbi:MAG: tripartite tricarboxylate transporter substrate binding protein [Burkholderiaceae bacterium]